MGFTFKFRVLVFQLHLEIPTSALLELRQQAEVCAQETGVPATHMRKIVDKTLPNDTPNKQFFHCIAYNTGYVDKDGHFIADKMLNWKIIDGTKDDIVKTVENCNKISKDVNIETLRAATACFHESYSVTIQSQ